MKYLMIMLMVLLAGVITGCGDNEPKKKPLSMEEKKKKNAEWEREMAEAEAEYRKADAKEAYQERLRNREEKIAKADTKETVRADTEEIVKTDREKIAQDNKLSLLKKKYNSKEIYLALGKTKKYILNLNKVDNSKFIKEREDFFTKEKTYKASSNTYFPYNKKVGRRKSDVHGRFKDVFTSRNNVKVWYYVSSKRFKSKGVYEKDPLLTEAHSKLPKLKSQYEKDKKAYEVAKSKNDANKTQLADQKTGSKTKVSLKDVAMNNHFKYKNILRSLKSRNKEEYDYLVGEIKRIYPKLPF